MINENANPFAYHDAKSEKLDELYAQVQRQQKTIDTLFECIGLLMRGENIRLDRAMKRKTLS